MHRESSMVCPPRRCLAVHTGNYWCAAGKLELTLCSKYPFSVGLEDRTSFDLEVRSGTPCIKGTRITVYDILEYLAGGMTEDQILEDFASLKREDIRAVLEFAAAHEFRSASSPDIGSSFFLRKPKAKGKETTSERISHISRLEFLT